MTNGPNKKTTNYNSNWFRFQGVEWVFLNLPFVFFITLLGLVYIFNAHSVESKLRRIDELKAEVNEVRSRYIDVNNELMFGSTQSQIQKRVAELELKAVKEAPIVINSKSD